MSILNICQIEMKFFSYDFDEINDFCGNIYLSTYLDEKHNRGYKKKYQRKMFFLNKGHFFLKYVRKCVCIQK